MSVVTTKYVEYWPLGSIRPGAPHGRFAVRAAGTGDSSGGVQQLLLSEDPTVSVGRLYLFQLFWWRHGDTTARGVDVTMRNVLAKNDSLEMFHFITEVGRGGSAWIYPGRPWLWRPHPAATVPTLLEINSSNVNTIVASVMVQGVWWDEGRLNRDRVGPDLQGLM